MQELQGSMFYQIFKACFICLGDDIRQVVHMTPKKDISNCLRSEVPRCIPHVPLIGPQTTKVKTYYMHAMCSE